MQWGTPLRHRAMICLWTFALAGLGPLLLASSPIEGTAESGIRRWTVEELLESFDTGGTPTLLDVRVVEEYDLGFLEGAVHIPLADLEGKMDALPRDRHILAYCSCPAEETSLMAAKMLKEAGFEDVGVLVGGFERWKALGGKVAAKTSWEEMFKVAEEPIGWSKRPSPQHRYGRTTATAFQGESSGMVQGDGTAATDVGSLFQVVPIQGWEGRTVTLRAATRTENVAGEARLWLRLEDGLGKMLSFTQSPEPIAGSAKDWQRSTLTAEVAEGATKLMFGIMLSGGGTLWVDDVQLTAGDDGVQLENPGFEH